jgi:hypothetical protein
MHMRYSPQLSVFAAFGLAQSGVAIFTEDKVKVASHHAKVASEPDFALAEKDGGPAA